MGSTDSRRESIVPSNAGTPDAEPEASSQNDKLAQVWQFGEDRFDPNSEGPRAIAIDADGSLFVFEYGKDGRCLVFDRAGNLVAGSISVGWCSEAVRVGTSLFLTVPSGSLVKFDTVSLQPSPALKVADERARWLCNAICSADGIVYVCAGDEGRVQKFDLSLQPRGDWTAPAHLREMDAADGTLYALARESGQSTVHAFSVSGSSLPTAEGDPLVLPANISDLCALSEHRVLLVNESGELLQYKVESAESGITWKLQGRTDLASEGWILSPNTVLRAAYDASAEILYLTFPPPHARVVAVPYSATDARRIRNPR